jgi:hypothetical protein
VLAWAWAAYLTRGEQDATAYARASLGGEDVLPGLSDVDVAIVLQADPEGPGLAAARATARWSRARRATPITDLMFDYPLILEADELTEAAGSSTLTFGLDGGRCRSDSVYFGERVSQDKLRLLERPGLYSATGDWRPIRGRKRRSSERPRDPQLRRIAAWLELSFWWQWACRACADPRRPSTASLCVKFVAEPARIWLWLKHGERPGRREEVLARALARLPEEEDGLRRALRLLRALPESPAPPLDEVLPVLVRLSSRIARLLADEVACEGATTVQLGDAGRAELILPHGDWRYPGSLAGGLMAPVLPLCDWRSLTCPELPDESFALTPEDPGDPAVLGAATRCQRYGPYPALARNGLLLFAGPWARSQLRAVKCALTDPVSFALRDGRAVASFPQVAGWSAHDWAARAIAEHGAWLATPIGSGDDPGGSTLAMLLSAARAALFADSLRDGGTAELSVTVAGAARRLAERSTAARAAAEESIAAYREFAADRTAPPERTVAALRELVRRLPAYVERRGAPPGSRSTPPRAALDGGTAAGRPRSSQR